MTKVSTLLGLALVAAPALAQDAATLAVRFEGLRNATGKICVTMWDQAQGFPRDPNTSMYRMCHTIASLTGDDGAAKLAFPDLQPGRYALAVFHDEDENGEIATGPFGRPREGFGFSNNPRIAFAPPTFDESAIAVTAPQATAMIRMTYY